MRIEPNPHREPLYHFPVVSDRVFGWKQAEHLTRCAWKTLHLSVVVEERICLCCVSLKFA
jgi:hypothetical protein